MSMSHIKVIKGLKRAIGISDAEVQFENLVLNQNQ
jgi:hypothetical protein